MPLISSKLVARVIEDIEDSRAVEEDEEDEDNALEEEEDEGNETRVADAPNGASDPKSSKDVDVVVVSTDRPMRRARVVAFDRASSEAVAAVATAKGVTLAYEMYAPSAMPAVGEPPQVVGMVVPWREVPQ